MNLLELERQIGAMFKRAGFDQPGFEARQLLLAALNLEMGDLLSAQAQTVAPQLVQKVQEWMQQRTDGVPLAYLAGKKGFWKSDFAVGPGVLVPRPESEHIVEVAIERSEDIDLHIIADLGCGTGCLGLSLLQEFPHAELFALDISEVAYKTARKNAETLGLAARVNVLCQAVETWQPPCAFELVVANPPYIAEGDPNVQPSVHDYEPHAALYSGPEGLETIRAWAAWSIKALQPGGIFVCEIGAGQSRDAHTIIKKIGFQKIQIKKDLAGHERVISALKKG